jgi:ADP-ribosylglycohydrolase
MLGERQTMQAIRIVVAGLAALLTVLPGAPLNGQGARPERRLTRSVLEDKIRGGWAGQMIGVSFGAPSEFQSNGKIIEGALPWTPDRVKEALHQDDLYVDMTFAAVMDTVGLGATIDDYAEAFKNSKYSLWHANASARRLLNQGIKAPLSGDPRYNIHANDIDFQIESDFIGLMTPGLPEESNRYCSLVGRVMNYGDGLYGGMFFGGMYSAAFFEHDVSKVVAAGLATIPAESGYARIVRDAVALWHKYPSDWRQAWTELQAKWDRDDSCTDGASRPFNIDARLNGAYVALGLLYGGGDFGRTLDITTRFGQDSDCNPSSAAGIVGVMLGFSGIPANYTSGIAALAGDRFDFTEYSFNTITQSTVARALKVIVAAGGRIDGDTITIPMQAAVPAPLEQWSMGVPSARLNPGNAAWTFTGEWTTDAGWDGAGVTERKTSTRSGNVATFTFDGSAVALAGRMAQDGGRADVFLDGAPAGMLDSYIPPRTFDNDLWHRDGLPAGPHTVRIVTRDDANPQSAGKRITFEFGIVYRAR